MNNIAVWLEGLGLEKYIKVFAENAIDFDIITQLSELDLKELGLLLGDRKRLLNGLSALSGRQPADATRVKSPPAPSLLASLEAEQHRFAMTFPARFSEILAQSIQLLHHKKRISYLALRQEFGMVHIK